MPTLAQWNDADNRLDRAETLLYDLVAEGYLPTYWQEELKKICSSLLDLRYAIDEEQEKLLHGDETPEQKLARLKQTLNKLEADLRDAGFTDTEIKAIYKIKAS